MAACSVLTCFLGKHLGYIQMWLLCLSKRQHSFIFIHKSSFISFQLFNGKMNPRICSYQNEHMSSWNHHMLEMLLFCLPLTVCGHLQSNNLYFDSTISKNLSEGCCVFFTYLDQVELWTRQSKCCPAQIPLRLLLDSHCHPNYWRSKRKQQQSHFKIIYFINI